MADPTAAEIARVRRYIGDTGTEQAFSDAEITVIWGDNTDDLSLTVIECLETLMADAAKLVSYRQGSSFEDEGKIFAHLEKVVAYWRKRAGVAAGPVETGEMSFDYYEDDGTFAESTDDLAYGVDWYV